MKKENLSSCPIHWATGGNSLSDAETGDELKF